MDIDSRASYPSKDLSNFAPHSFFLDGVLCACMEGFLQSLKDDAILIQYDICKLIGIHAKRWGNAHNMRWKELQVLWWQGIEYDRHSDAYQTLLDRAYEALFMQCPEFRDALVKTGREILTHSIGKSDSYDTILTEDEFCSRLMKLRDRLCA